MTVWSSFCTGNPESNRPPTNAFNGSTPTTTSEGQTVNKNQYWMPSSNNTVTFTPPTPIPIASNLKIYYFMGSNSEECSSVFTFNGTYTPVTQFYFGYPGPSPISTSLWFDAGSNQYSRIFEIPASQLGGQLTSIRIYKSTNSNDFSGITAIAIDENILVDGTPYPPLPPSPIQDNDMFLVNRAGASYKMKASNLSGMQADDLMLVDDNGISKKVRKANWSLIPNNALMLVLVDGTEMKVSGENFKNYVGVT